MCSSSLKPKHSAVRPDLLSRLLCTVLILISSFHSFSQSKDTLYFYNKSKVVGELLNMNLGRLEFDAVGIGIVKIKNSNIESIHAISNNFRIETLRGRELQGYLVRSNKPGTVIIHSVVTSQEIRIDSIASLLYYGKTLKSRFTGNVSAGYSYTKSSGIGRLNTDGAIRYNTSKGQTKLTGDMIVTYDSVSANAERANLSIGHEHTIAPLWGVIGILKYQRNVELGLARRWQEAGGLAREFLISKRQMAVGVAGVAINQELNFEGSETNTAEAMFQANYDFYSFVNPNLTLSFVESAFISITDQDRTRLDGSISLDYEIITDFYINLQFYHNYDSRSPGTDEPNFDNGFVAGLRYKF